MKYHWIIDMGHGGMNQETGDYNTKGKRYNHGDFIIYEGVINRSIGLRLYSMLQLSGIRCSLSPDESINVDMPLWQRVSNADKIYGNDSSTIFLSIHSNAGGGSGNEIFTSPGQTKSDKVANIFSEIYEKLLPEFKLRKDMSDGDNDKESNFYVLRKTDCPALLVENLFFDNRKEAEYLMSETGQERFAKTIFRCIEKTEELEPI